MRFIGTLLTLCLNMRDWEWHDLGYKFKYKLIKSKVMDIQVIAEALIYREHGWAVAEQFTTTWDDRDVVTFGEQNETALGYIYGTISELIESNSLNEDAIDELEEYLDKMDDALEYLTK